MNIFYTADLHAGHNHVATLRGFTSAEEHDETIRRNWNQMVGPKDIVWILGDIALNARHGLGFVETLNGRKQLVLGNHDQPWPGHRRGYTHQKSWGQFFESMQAFAVHQIGEHRVLLSHFPYWGDHENTGERFTQYRLRDEGNWLLHGHTHGKERHHDERMIHVGLDAWDLKPVPRGVIAKIIGGRDE